MRRFFVASIGCIFMLSAAGSICASDLQEAALPPIGYIGVWADAAHSVREISPAQYSTFDAWIWILPSENGMQAAEFAVSFPATTPMISSIQHPNITVALGTLAGGMSLAFGEGMCNMDWVWTHRVTMIQLALPAVLAKIDIIPHPGTLPVPAYQAATCELGYPIEPLIYITALYIGDWVPHAAVLTGATVVNSLAVQASLSGGCYDMSWTGYSLDHFFKLRNVADPTDTIMMTDVDEDQLIFVLERQMTPGTTYALEAHLCCFYGYCADSRWEFLYDDETATLLQSCSASFAGSGVEIAWELSEVDEGAEFFVSRSENEADFVALDMAGLAREGLDFTYTDSRVEPGEKYVYKVEYTIDGKSRLLFISEEIRTPAALLALDQNRPNPFNPSTTISFTLPIECAVRLEVYDVSGRLVARLLDGKRLGAGAHNVEWHGRHASGRSAASGIYVYRLTAGRETISKKMVLLR